MKDQILGIKSALHRVLRPYLEMKKLTFSQQVILVEDLGTAIQKRVEVFERVNNGHETIEERIVKSEPEPMMLQRSYD
jgi:hypothetical protein